MRRAGASMDATVSRMQATGKQLATVGRTMSMALTLPLVAAGAFAFKAASDLDESMSKVNVVFEDSADTIQKWARDAAQNMGMARQQALEAAGTFGNFFRAMGTSIPDATRMSKSLVQLAADLASFNNANPEEVLLALRAGLAGEAEPLRKFGVSLSAARVEAEGLAQGLDKTYQEMTAAEKAALAYEIILKDTTLAQGDFDRTSGGAANQMRIMRAELTDAAAEIGAILLPVIVKLIGHVRDLTRWFSGLSPGVQTATIAFGAFLAALGPVLAVVGNLMKAMSALVTAYGAIGNGIILMLPKLGAATAAFMALSVAQMAAYTAGAALLVVGAALAINWLSGASSVDRLRDSQRALVAELDKQARASGNAQGALDTMRASLEESRRRAEALRQSIAELSGAEYEGGATIGEVNAKRRELAEALAVEATRTDELREKVSALKDEVRAAKEAEAARSEELDRVAAGTLALADASDEARTAIQNLQNAYLAAAGGALGYHAAQIAVQDAQLRLTELETSGTATELELAAARNDLEQRTLSAASAANKMMTDEAELARVIKTDGVGGLVAMRDNLIAVRDREGDASGAIQTHIDRITTLIDWLNAIPAQKTTDIYINEFRSLIQSGAPSPFPVYGAEGAIVSRPTIALIAEAGPEALVPLNRMPGASPLPGGMPSGGGPIFVQVVMPDGRVLAETVFNEASRAGGPRLSSKAVV